MKKIQDDNYKLLNRLAEAEKYFTKEEYAGIVKRAKELFECGKHATCEKELDSLPSSGELLERLVDKLKDKHLYRTLRKIEGKVTNDLLTLKGLMSLGTHVVIEIEQGNKEYGILLPNILEKISELAYGI